MQQERGTEQRFWEGIVHAIPTPFYVIEIDTYRIVAANSAHMPSRDAIGKPCHEVSHRSPIPCAGENHLCPLDIVRDTGRMVVLEHVHGGDAGSERYIEVHGYPVFAEDGKLTHMIEFSLDITERKQAMAELREKNEELHQAYAKLQSAQQQLVQQEKLAVIGQLAAGVAHEINNPVGFISSNLGSLRRYVEKLQSTMEVLLASVSPDRHEEVEAMLQRQKIPFVCQDIRDLLNECGEGLDRINRIVRGLKNFSRFDQEQVEVADLNACLDETLNVAWNELKYKARVVKEFGDLPLIRCMPRQLDQVFVNLLVNAAQAMEQQGEITIKTWAADQAVFVAIADTGCGIPPDRLAQIFMPFFTTKEAGKGTGLGLSISKEIVERHHGSLSVTSEEGKGTTFLLQLPVLPADAWAVPETCMRGADK